LPFIVRNTQKRRSSSVGRRESPLEARARAWARARGIVNAKLTGLDGIQDAIFFPPGGRPVIGEFKAKGVGSRSLQEATQPWYAAKLAHEGYDVHVWDTWEKFYETMGRYEGCRATFKMKK
jgi:hypothetical protein